MERIAGALTADGIVAAESGRNMPRIMSGDAEFACEARRRLGTGDGFNQRQRHWQGRRDAGRSNHAAISDITAVRYPGHPRADVRRFAAVKPVRRFPPPLTQTGMTESQPARAHADDLRTAVQLSLYPTDWRRRFRIVQCGHRQVVGSVLVRRIKISRRQLLFHGQNGHHARQAGLLCDAEKICPA